MALHAIVTAGGRLPRELESLTSSRVKALLPLGGRSLLDSALAALRSAGPDGQPLISDIAVVGSDEVGSAVAASEHSALHLGEGQNVVDNILRGFAQLGQERHDYLILSPDLPFVSGESLANFIAAARGNSDFAAPLVSRETFLAQYPGAPNRFERIDGRHVTMGSAIFFSGAMLRSNIPLMQDFFRLRKQPHKLALMLGLPIVFGFLTGRLRLSMLEQRLEQLMGGRVRAFELSDAGIAYDIDDRQNYEYALTHLPA
jgi:molybdopterin-guanine dinucleotide biosynthesis protein A